eukprot:scaffold28270_cov107-Isochrysis_galbana.AAC.2
MAERALCSFEGDGAPLSSQQQAGRDCGAAVVRTSKRPPSSPSPISPLPGSQASLPAPRGCGVRAKGSGSVGGVGA